MLLRVIRYCSTFAAYLQKRESLRMALLLNRYPIKFIDQQFNYLLQKFNINQTITQNNYQVLRQQIINAPHKEKRPIDYNTTMFVHF